MIFLGMFCLFVLIRIFLDIFNEKTNFAQTTFLTSYIFNLEIQLRLLTNILISLVAVQIGASIAIMWNASGIEKPNMILKDINWVRVGLILFYMGLPFLIYKYVLVALIVISRGYLAFHHEGAEALFSSGLIITFFFRLSWCGFFIFLAGMPNKKQLYFNLFIFSLTLIPLILQGLRGPVMCTILTLFWYVMYVNNLKVKTWQLIIFLSAAIMLNAFVGALRADSVSDFMDTDNKSKKFLYNMGVTIQVVGYSIEHDEKLEDYSIANMFAMLRQFVFVAKNKILRVRELPTKQEFIEKFGYLGFWITDIVNPARLKAGNSIGGSFLAEFFLVGKEWMQFLGSFLIGFFTVTLVEKFRKKRIGILFLLFFIPSWIFIPRDSTFNFITDNMSNIILFFALYIIIIMVLFIRKVSYRLN